MTIRNFKQLFSLMFAIILGSFGFSLGLYIKNTPKLFGAGDAKTYIGSLVLGFNEMSGNILYIIMLMIAFAIIGMLIGVIFGPKFAQKIVHAGNSIERMSTREKVAVGVGSILGILLTVPFYLLLNRLPLPIGLFLTLLLGVIFIYLFIRGIMSMKDEFTFVRRDGSGNGSTEVSMDHCKILDTNVIIDGRIADICRTGFLEGAIYVPGFVLDELQHIADSSDSLKRARGRRGLDILNAMQKEFPLIVRSFDNVGDESSAQEEVDARLVTLAKELNGAIVTNDFNLNKVAALQGVLVLNVNELANALKPVVLPGEEMPVMIIKEGKEQYQGVAYLDDGTMVVVEDGRRHIGEHTEVVVTSVLQTVAGKMIFARLKGQIIEDEDGRDGGPRGPSSRPRFKIR